MVSLVEKGAVELAPQTSPGFYSWLFVVMKTSGSWRPVIDLLLLNLRVLKTSFKMETLQLVLLSVQRGDWMVSLDFNCLFSPWVIPTSGWVGFGVKAYSSSLCCSLTKTGMSVGAHGLTDLLWTQ